MWGYGSTSEMSYVTNPKIFTFAPVGIIRADIWRPDSHFKRRPAGNVRDNAIQSAGGMAVLTSDRLAVYRPSLVNTVRSVVCSVSYWPSYRRLSHVGHQRIQGAFKCRPPLITRLHRLQVATKYRIPSKVDSYRL